MTSWKLRCHEFNDSWHSNDDSHWNQMLGDRFVSLHLNPSVVYWCKDDIDYRCGILLVNIRRSIGAKRIERVSEKIGEVLEKDSASFKSCASNFLHRLVDKLRCVNILNIGHYSQRFIVSRSDRHAILRTSSRPRVVPFWDIQRSSQCLIPT
jgi:hypothetical protein